jgi:hypothetical protein
MVYDFFVVLLFIGWTWVNEAEKDVGTIKLCSIATLLKITSAFYKLCFHRQHLVKKACHVLHGKVTLVQGRTVKINSLLCLF